MMTILQNIAEYTDALKAVKAHCMAARVIEASGKVIIEYPAGYEEALGHGGLRVDRNAVMLRRAVEQMERDWLRSFPSGNGMH